MEYFNSIFRYWRFQYLWCGKNFSLIFQIKFSFVI